jgi:hypothetical protein
MDVIIDRFEGEYAIIELPGNKTIQVPRELFPSAREGDVFTIARNDEKTNERRKSIRERFDKLKKS